MTLNHDKDVSWLAFSETARDIQTRNGSRDMYARVEEKGSWTGVLRDDLKEFIARQRSFFLGTVNSDLQPYIQHRGGPPGFLKVIDDTTVAFADYSGNKQFITQANLQDNSKAFIFLMDYEMQRRLKLWGEARVIEDDADLMAELMPDRYDATPERVVIFDVKLWNLNCTAHIPKRFEAQDVYHALAARDAKIAELEEALLELKDGR